MPRDDLSIDFVRKSIPMPQAVESLDPALILDDWTNRVQNLPEEIRFIQDEIANKDQHVADCLRAIEDRDARLQKWIKAHGSHAPNPSEAAWRQVIRDNFARAEQLQTEKIALTQRLQTIMDKHVRHLDIQIKMLYDRAEPGFTDPDELPSLLRPSAANNSAPSARAVNPAANPVTAALSPLANPATQPGPKGANNQLRAIQTNLQHPAVSSSAPTSPAATMIHNKRGPRESSAGPASGSLQRGPRANTGLGGAPSASSGLARHSSLGPGTPKGHTSATFVQRAGSAGPGPRLKAGSVSGRKGTPSGSSGRGIKKGTPGANGGGSTTTTTNPSANGPKSGLQRVRKNAKNSPSSTAESELSDADSAVSGDESDTRAASAGGGGRATPRSGGSGGPGSSGGGAADLLATRPDSSHNNEGNRGDAPRTKRDNNNDDDDDKKYCICQNVSFGDMIACDNDDCPYEWFHWSCVGLKSEPQGGTWYCPRCTADMKKGK